MAGVQVSRKSLLEEPGDYSFAEYAEYILRFARNREFYTADRFRLFQEKGYITRLALTELSWAAEIGYFQ
jgi:hypothetical protein